MNVEETLRKGLRTTPKYLPIWYNFDKYGSALFDRFMTDNHYYYIYASEMPLINQHVQDMISQVPTPTTVLVDMGCGNCEKTRIFIDAILKRQSKLEFVPVDISKDYLQETAQAISRDYGSKLDVRPIAGDYSVGIDALRNIKGNKLIVWLGGSLGNLSYQVQVDRLESLAQVMSATDRMIITLDVTQNAEEVELAYNDPTGLSADLHLNGIRRLNREYDSDIDIGKLQMEAKFIQRTESTATSNVLIRAKAKETQSYDIDGLGISITLEEGEYINLYEGEGLSCKYTTEQIRTLVQTGKHKLERFWVDPKQHVAICCIGKVESFL